MSCSDFEFNGQRLSDFGCILCTFGDAGLEITSVGSKLSLNTINRSMINEFTKMSTKYEEPYEYHLQICKNPCGNYNVGQDLLEEELVARLVRWLNKKRYCKFKKIYHDGKCSDMYFIGTFRDINLVKMGERIVGLDATFQANAPFGYYEPLEYYMEFASSDDEFCIYDTSDEEGFIYPSKLQITILADGDLEIANSMETKRTIIKNCIAGETITLDAANKLIASDVAHPRLYNDFNYAFVKIINTSREIVNPLFSEGEDVRENTFTVSLPCNIYLQYSPICKMGVI